MKRLSICLLFWSCCTLCMAVPARGADPLTSVKQFSDFPKIDLKRLQEGEILAQRGPLMNFPNGISAQLCFVVPVPPAETAKRLQSWDSTRCESLKVYASQGLKKPSQFQDFNALRLDPRHRPVKWLLDKALATTPTKSELNLTRIEAYQLAGCLKKDSNPGTAGSCWSSLLLERATAFQRNGLAGMLPYEMGEESVSPAAQLRSMLQEQPRIMGEFAPILQRAGFQNNGPDAPPLTPYYYWSMFDADHHATLTLGALYELLIGDHYQMLDLCYYVSGNFYTAVTLYEIWPIRDGDKTASLVWRGDFFAAPLLRFTKGVERIAYGAIMIQEIKKEISCFRE